MKHGAMQIINTGIIIIMFIAAVQIVTAIGIRPAKTEIAYSNYDQKFVFDILNDDSSEREVNLTILDDVYGLVELNETAIKFSRGESVKSVSGIIKFADSKKFYGDTIIRILAEESSYKKTTQDNPEFLTLSGVITKLIIKVPRPGKYLKFGELIIFQSGHTVEITVPIENIGTETIKDVYSVAEIFFNNSRIDMLEAKNQKIVPFTKSKLVFTFVPEFYGNFDFKGRVFYDGLKDNFEFKFDVEPGATEIFVPEPLPEKDDKTQLITIYILILIAVLSLAINLLKAAHLNRNLKKHKIHFKRHHKWRLK